jgi:hypothetical protein
MLFDWVLFLAYPNLFGIKGFVVVVVDVLIIDIVEEVHPDLSTSNGGQCSPFIYF